ncbi:MAG: hypothetical protein A2136_03150 [Chloroflexi bacterium RBG_16_54_11]|nr:MAG: hypothetical protein A2136_03150 [Chloroflexi bacterium RBG_16_54_11]
MVLGFQHIGIRPPEFLLRWVYFHRLPVLSRSYMEINRALVRVGEKPAIQDTPAERTDSLIKIIPSATAPASQLLAEYQTSAYSPYPADLDVAQKAGHEIRKLSWVAWLSRILSRFQEPDRTRRL